MTWEEGSDTDVSFIMSRTIENKTGQRAMAYVIALNKLLAAPPCGKHGRLFLIFEWSFTSRL